MARKTKEDALETREKLLASALDVMSEKPFSNVSMSYIAERVGLSKGAVYWHFKNKNDLLVNLLEDICSTAGRDLYRFEDFPETFEGLRNFFKKKLTIAMNSVRIQKINRLLHRRHEWPNEVFERVIAFVRDMTLNEREMVTLIIAKSQQRNEIISDYPADELAMLLSAIFHGLFFFQLHEFYKIDLSKYTDFLLDAIEKMLKYESHDTNINDRQNTQSERDGVTQQ
ncbi:MAG: TetR family transcriptional regulator [Synergistaceae bacterium]|nr:TetR family transcriptional regulator [Synergistaceae bacterium]